MDLFEFENIDVSEMTDTELINELGHLKPYSFRVCRFKRTNKGYIDTNGNRVEISTLMNKPHLITDDNGAYLERVVK